MTCIKFADKGSAPGYLFSCRYGRLASPGPRLNRPGR